mgnify:CR=1 FL=1|tara:strand:+ start:456 stop:1664 length:1209 start_codon:yes stop_codon:yes gene_type:complete
MLSKIIFKNIINLIIFNCVNLFVPLILIPLIITKFNTKVYGEFIFYNSIFILLGFILNLGSTQSALILINKYKKSITEVYSSILTLKLCIMFFFLLTYYILSELLVDLIPNYTIYYIYFLVYELFLSDWVYYYKNKLNIMALINSLNKLFPLICLLLFDKYINAFSTLLLIFLTSSILSGIISIIYLYFKNIKFKFQSILTIKNNLKIIFSFFWVFLLGKTRLIANKLVVGSFFSFELLAVFDIAEKIKNITLLPSQIIVDSNYSTQSKSFNTLLFKKTMLMVLISTITLILLSLAVIKNLFIFKDINKDFLFSILLAFSPLLILQSVNYHIQKSYLLSTSKLKLLNRVSIISSLSFFLILSFLLILNNVSIYCLIINNIMSALIASFFYIKYIINENILFK